jgi:hypothetical protein
MDSEHDLARAIGAEIERLFVSRLARRPGGHLIEGRPAELELRVSLDGPGTGPARVAGQLLAAIDRWIDDAVQQAAAFRPGSAYCHRCDAAECEHGRPPSVRHVFVGYAATGQPLWEDFAQHCLQIRHPDIDRLYEPVPALLTLIQGREALHGAMLDAFRNPTHEILAQIVAGFFPLRLRAEEGRGVLALTIQVVASYGRRAPARLGLNLLGRGPAGRDLEQLWDSQGEPPWNRAVRWAQAALQTVPARPRSAEARSALAVRAEGILQGLARRLDRDHRARGRRTRHAAERHASGTRPTSKAVDDAREAGAEALRVDGRSGAIVVLGARGRTHFFSPDGRHVSSARYSREAIERKQRVELWRLASSDEVATFRSRLPG